MKISIEQSRRRVREIEIDGIPQCQKVDAHVGEDKLGIRYYPEVGSAVAVGVGGFALLWFVIKKKSLEELIEIFKKH